MSKFKERLGEPMFWGGLVIYVGLPFGCSYLLGAHINLSTIIEASILYTLVFVFILPRL